MAVVTFTELKTNVRSLLGEATASFWTEDDITAALVTAIQNVQYDVLSAFDTNLKALEKIFNSQLRFDTYVGAGHIYHEFAGYQVLKILSMESDDVPWEEVDGDYLVSVRGYEGDLALSASQARLYSFSQGIVESSIIDLYPAITIGQEYTIKHIKRAEESGNMNLPLVPNLQEIAVLDAVAHVAKNKTMDLKLANSCLEQRELKLKHIRESYGNAR